HATGLEQLEPLVAEPGCVHGVLRVETVRFDQLRPVDAFLAACAEQALLLAAEIAEVAASCAAREQRRRERLQLETELRPHERRVVPDEQQQEHRRMPLEREPDVLPEAVRDEVEVAGGP